VAKNLPYLDHRRPIPIAHRGGDQAAVENTMPAFEHALSLGYRYLETDVHVSADGVLVAYHDADLTRLTGRPGTIADRTWAELEAIDLGGASIPRLDDLFATFPEARFNIDPKVDAAVVPLGDAIAAHGAVDRVGIGAFDDARITALQQRFGPELCTSPGPAELLDYLARPSDGAFATHGCLQIPPSFGQFELTSELIEAAHALGLQVHVWTINETHEMHRLLDLGVDAVMTDNVSELKAILIERDEWNTNAN
jgi:glycerophosphoryl diester phosphodiesterase